MTHLRTKTRLKTLGTVIAAAGARDRIRGFATMCCRKVRIRLES